MKHHTSFESLASGHYVPVCSCGFRGACVSTAVAALAAANAHARGQGAEPQPPPFGPTPKLKTVGYELEVRPYDGVWSKFEGRIIALLRYEDSEGEHRHHLLPDRGPASNGRTFVTTRPYWLRSRSRERLEARLKDKLDRHTAERRRQKAERIPLTDTMAGWQ